MADTYRRSHAQQQVLSITYHGFGKSESTTFDIELTALKWLTAAGMCWREVPIILKGTRRKASSHTMYSGYMPWTG